MKRKITAIALAVCILVVGVVGATMSYFTDTDSKTNTFTFGKVDITLTEDSVSTMTGTPRIYGKEDGNVTLKEDGGYKYDKILPGQIYSKIPTVKVESDSLDAYVVVTATVPAVYDFDGMLGGVVSPSVAKVEHYVNAATGKNTYVFYYLQPVTAGNSVTPFNTVTVNPALTKDVMGQTFDVVVNAYAIQTDGFTKVEDAFNAAFGSAREEFGVPFKIQDFSTTAAVTKDATGKIEDKVVTNPDNTIKVTIPGAAVDETATEVKVTITPTNAPAEGVAVNAETETVASYDISVTGLKAGNITKLPVSFYVGKDLASVKVYHKAQLITDAQYDAATGYVSFETDNFSPFDVVYSAPTATITTNGKDVNYGTLTEAIEAAEDGDTIVLKKDIVAELPNAYGYNNEPAYEITKSITLDGNGKTVTASTTTWAKYDNKITGMVFSIGSQNANYTTPATVTVKNLTVVGHKDMKHGFSIVKSENANTIATFENVTVTGCGANAFSVNGTTVTMNNVTTSNCGWGGVDVDKGGNLTVNSGTYDLVKTDHPESNTIAIKGGSFVADPAAYLAEGYAFGKGADGNYVVMNAANNTLNVATANELRAAIDFLGNVPDPGYPKNVSWKLNITDDIDMTNVSWKNVSLVLSNRVNLAIDGQNHAIKNLTVNNDGKAALFAEAGATGYFKNTMTISNLTIKDSSFTNTLVGGGPENSAAAFVAHATDECSMTNCHVEHCIIASQKFAGALYGYDAHGSSTPVFTNCSVKNTTVKSLRAADDTTSTSVGGFVGYTQSTIKMENCAVSGNTVSGIYAGSFYGNLNCDGYFKNCTVDDKIASSQAEVDGRPNYGRAIFE